ncbi:aldehyde dehydrogenase family protein [Thermoleophilia bacterium SCSIO 60948]|nr:aldehyde dehydrogenase family protein [Thermoleophilia bacterium SCSIO 60948]
MSTAVEEAEKVAGSSDEVVAVKRPVDGETIRELPVADAAEVAATAARLRAAQGEWAELGFAGRREWLERLRDWMLAESERIADIMQAESGKVRADATLEVPYCADAINFYSANAAEFLADETPSAHFPALKVKRLRITRDPVGLVGVISPWNFPLILSLGDAIPALAAGNAVLIKPSELTPLCLMAVIEGWKQIGAPDVLDYVNGFGETGGALVDEADYVQFTGSDKTGRLVLKRAAETLTPVSLELGGKDPALVLRDANVERAANGVAFGGLMNSGQICMSIERVYVERPIYDEFLGKLTEKVEALRQGADGRTYTADVGAMTSPAQTDIVERHVTDAREKGARILTGGRRGDGPGDWYEPTVIADVDHSMDVMRDETFGPVISVMAVEDAEQAVELANDSRYGLSGSIFSGDVKAAERMARRLEMGSCNVNDTLINYNALELPMGGWKTSGIGTRHGRDGIRKFTRTRSILSPRGPELDSEILWYPITPAKRGFFAKVTRFFGGRGLGRFGIERRG